MPVIGGELQTFTETATECADLDRFSCGDKRHAYETTVERIIALHRFGTHPEGPATLRVTREMPAGTPVAVAFIYWRFGPRLRHRWLSGDEYAGAAYLDVLALSETYRAEGDPFTYEGLPVSDYVLAETLRFIEEHEGEMPIVQGLVEADNDACRDLLVRHGFEQPFESGLGGGDLLYVCLPEDERGR
jgi:hypothetical protein